MAPQHRQIFLHQLMGLHGGGEFSGDLPPPGEHHDPAGDLVQPVHRGDIGVLLPLGQVVLPQQLRHTPAAFAVLRQHPHGLAADHQVGVLIQNLQRLHGSPAAAAPIGPALAALPAPAAVPPAAAAQLQPQNEHDHQHHDGHQSQLHPGLGEKRLHGSLGHQEP